MAYIQAILALIPIIKTLIDAFIKTPQETRDAFLTQLNDAMKKAVHDKDPVDLSKLINGGL